MRRDNTIIVETLINKMFEISGNSITFKDIKGRKDDWYAEYTMTEDECEEWMKWGTEYLRKTLKMTKKMALTEMSMFNLSYGLKIGEPQN
jgi:hypothetical protein